MNKRKLIEQCELTLKQNDLGSWTRPAPGLYPNQWLWDSCFTAIGLRHVDAKRAQAEIDSLFRGQWKNGMMPHIIESPEDYYGIKLWDKTRSKLQPKNLVTSSITQPPMLAEAIVLVGEKLSKSERIKWYKHRFNQLLAYHEWLYRERDPECVGLVSLLHPWESGIDNSPAWMQLIHSQHIPIWITLLRCLDFTSLLNALRKDTRFVPAAERIDPIDGLLLYFHVKKVQKHKGHSKQAIKHSSVVMQDLLFNSILVRANSQLRLIADEINTEIPTWLITRMRKAESSLKLFWDEKSNSYLDINFQTKLHTNQPSIGRYLPLYSGAISQQRAKQLATEIMSEINSTNYPIASVPKESTYFSHHRYWQGPMWVNTNWLIINGLEQYGFFELAENLKSRTLELIERYGAHEYFSPIDGTPAGAHQFSWSAALAIDLAKSTNKMMS